MLRKALVTTILGIAILVPGLATPAQSEEPAQSGLQRLSSSVNRFGEDVNQLGKNLVGLVLPKEKSEKKAADTQPSYEEPYKGRAGSVFTRYRSSQTDQPQEASSTKVAFPTRPQATKDVTHSTHTEEQLPDQWPYVDESTDSEPQSEVQLLPSHPQSTNEKDTPSFRSTTSTLKAQTPSTIETPTRTVSPSLDAKTKTAAPSLSQQPLHKRLQVLKRSPFEHSYANEEATENTQGPTLQVEPTEAVSVEPTTTTRNSSSSRIQTQRSNVNSGPTLKQPGTTPLTLKKPQNKNVVVNETSNPGPSNRMASTPTQHISVGAQKPVPQTRQQVLISRDCPILNVQTMGPAKINIGREAKYKVLLENQGEVAAREVLVTVELPEWADVVGTEAEQGTAAIDRSAASRRLCWRLEDLPGKTRREMDLRLIPRERRPIELAVRSSFTQVASQAVIEVQEPQLSMRLIGPKQIQFGEAELFKLEILNSGNGTAEDMVLTLLPLTKSGLPTTHKLGNLEADAKRVIDLELTAQQLENISVEAELKCTASASAKLIEKLTVLAPQVKAGVFGPAVRFLGTKGVYQIKVANFGNFESKDLQVKAIVPQEAKFIKGSEGVQFEEHSNTAMWKIESLKPGKEEVLELECEMTDQGTARLVVNVEDGRYTELSKVAAIRVEAMADLTMEVVDPKGPVSIGEEAVYEIHIRNRGTRPAENINAIAYFSEGVEPVSASGMKHRITPGQVSFQTIGSIPPDEVVVLKVHAVAQTTGNHMFRAETECLSLNTKLIGEETTHFYRGARLADNTELTADSDNEPRQTVDRRNEPTLAPQRSAPFRR